MNTLDLIKLDISGLSRLIRNKEISPVELTKACLERIKEINPKTNGFLTILEKEALESAIIAEDEII